MLMLFLYSYSYVFVTCMYTYTYTHMYRGRSARVLEVYDQGAPALSSRSEWLQSVVEQLLPPPLRYRLVWQVSLMKYEYEWEA